MSLLSRIRHPFALSESLPKNMATELGDTGMGYWGYVSPDISRRIRELEYLHDLQGMRAYPVYDRMRLSDPKVAGLRYATDLPLLKADVNIVSADPKSPAANKVKEAVEDALFNRMAYSWRSTLSEILLYRDYGFAPFEIIWNTDGGQVGIDRLAYRPPGTVWWIWGSAGRIDKIEQSVFGHWLTIPGEKLVWFVNKREGENWRGRSILRPMHKPWYQKERLETLLLILIERMGGIPVFKEGNAVAADKTLQAKIDSIMARFRMGETMGLRLPPDVDFSLLPSVAKVEDVIHAIEYYDTQLSNVVLAQVLDLGKTATGSRALGMTLGDMLEEACEAEANQIEDTFNAREGLIWQFVSYNFGEDPDIMPKLQFGKMGKVDPLVFGEGLNYLTQAGLTFDDPLTAEAIRHLYNLPELDPDALDSQDIYLEQMKNKQEQSATAVENLSSVPPPTPAQVPAPSPPQLGAGTPSIAAQTQAVRAGISPETQADVSKPASPIAAPMLPAQRPPVLHASERSYRPAPTAKLGRLEQFCDLSEVAATMDGTKDAIKAATATTREAQATELAKRARDAAAKGRAASFVASRPPMVDALTRQIVTVLTEHYQAGRQQVDDELDRQRRGETVAQEIAKAGRGEASTQLATVAPTKVVSAAVAAKIAQEAEIAARQISAAAQAAAAQQSMRDASTPLADDVFEEGIMRESDAAALRTGGTVMRVLSSGRADEAEAQSSDIEDGVYSAILDQNTCGVCEGDDGDETTDLSEASQWTPNPNCEGGTNCRCMVFYELRQGAS